MIRASRLSLALLCGQSQHADSDVLVGGDRKAAELGTAVHAWLGAKIKEIENCVDPREIAARYGVDCEECENLCWQAWRMWWQLWEWFPDPQTEVHLAAGDWTGTVDVFSIGNYGCFSDGSPCPSATVLDWKTGWREGDAIPQLQAYGWLAFQKYPEVASVYAVIAWVRTGEVERFLWTREELEAWHAQTVETLEKEKDVYRPGPQCGICPRAACDAKKNLLILSASWLTMVTRPVTTAWAPPTEPGERGKLWADVLWRAKLVEDAVKQARDMVRADVQASGGSLPLPDGQELALVPEIRREIDYATGVKIMELYLPDDQIHGCLTVRKTAVEKAVMATAARGTKGKIVQRMLAELDEVGALKETRNWKLKIRSTNNVERIAGDAGSDSAGGTGDTGESGD